MKRNGASTSHDHAQGYIAVRLSAARGVGRKGGGPARGRGGEPDPAGSALRRRRSSSASRWCWPAPRRAGLRCLEQIGVEPDALRPPPSTKRRARASARARWRAGWPAPRRRRRERLHREPELAECLRAGGGYGRRGWQRVLMKPEYLDEAAAALQLLSGRSHRVYTAVCFITSSGAVRMRTVETRVRFKRLSSEEVEAYLASGEWRGKAGGYAIQGIAGAFVQKARRLVFGRGRAAAQRGCRICWWARACRSISAGSTARRSIPVSDDRREDPDTRKTARPDARSAASRATRTIARSARALRRCRFGPLAVGELCDAAAGERAFGDPDDRSAERGGKAAEAMSTPVYPVILCGGSGTRLWPLSRAQYPKQFIPLIDGDGREPAAATLRRLPQ